MTSLRANSTLPGLTGTPLRLRMRNSSRWMWTGCCQPPELFWMIHRSAVLICGESRKRVQSMNCPLTCHSPLPRSNRNVRVMRGVTWLMSGSEIGANTASFAVAGTSGNDTGSGSKLVSAGAVADEPELEQLVALAGRAGSCRSARGR